MSADNVYKLDFLLLDFLTLYDYYYALLVGAGGRSDNEITISILKTFMLCVANTNILAVPLLLVARD